MSKDLNHYRGLPYTLRVDRFHEEEDGKAYYCAAYEQLPQVKGVHEDRLLAIKLAKELFDAFVEAQIHWGAPIPEPAEQRSRKRGGLYGFATAHPTGATPEDSLQLDKAPVTSQAEAEVVLLAG